MSTWAYHAKRLAREQCAVSTVEYAVVLALIVLVSIVAISSLGTRVTTTADTLSGNLPTGGGS